MSDNYTKQSDIGFVLVGPDAVAEARRMHHLASADPELDGTLTGPAHEAKYSLERAEASAEHWRSRGVDPYKNGALETADVSADAETTEGPRVKK